VLDLFAVPGDVRPVPGGQGASVVAGDLVLSPGRDPATSDWLDPRLARLAVDLDTRPRRTLRVAMPVPARDGSWVVDGWGASRYEPATSACRDLGVLLATGRLFHAVLARAFPVCPPLDGRADQWAAAERLAFSSAGSVAGAVGARDRRRPLLTALAAQLLDTDLGPAQLVHGDLAGNVLLDAEGVPVVIDVAPYWRPIRWAEAVCVLDAVLWHGADAAALNTWRHGADRQALLRAAAFRLLSDGPGCAVDRYTEALTPLLH
jgi:uncharacterized protein (TIGR02569 family)